MELDSIDVAQERKRMIGLGIVIGLVVLAAIILFLWGGVLNRGTLRVLSKAPFSVEIFGGETFICENSPCEIKQKRGIKDLILRKDGHESILTEVRIKLWRSVDLEVEFRATPQIVEVDEIPEFPVPVRYQIITDSRNQMQKLVNADDPQKTAIVYFQRKLKSPRIIASKEGLSNFVLILDDNEIYKVDLREKARNGLNEAQLEGITTGEWSSRGDYLVFSKIDSDYLWLFGDQGVKRLDLIGEISQVAWIRDDELVFVTNQSYQTLTGAGKYGDDYFKLLNEPSVLGFTFGIYHPDENSYVRIETFSEISEMPEKLIPSANGREVYFGESSGANGAVERNFKIVF